MSTDIGSGVAIRAAEFKELFSRHPAGVAVITLADPDHPERPVGFTATSVISVSAAPPVLAFVIADTSSSWPSLVRSESIVVNFLPAEGAGLSTRFATPGIDRFATTAWDRLETGEPVLAAAGSWARCLVLNRHDEGASHLVTAQVERSHLGDRRSPLVFHDRTYHRIGDSSRV